MTGVAGFIGMHVAIRLLNDGHEVAGLDNLNDYYDVNLKQARLDHIGSPNQFTFHKFDLSDKDYINALFSEFRPEVVINLAAQAGVRYSLKNPHSYIDSNIIGFTNVLEACRNYEISQLIYASSSSVYGLNEDMPFHEGQNVDHPLALYGATKKANELLAHSYSHLFGCQSRPANIPPHALMRKFILSPVITDKIIVTKEMTAAALLKCLYEDTARATNTQKAGNPALAR